MVQKGKIAGVKRKASVKEEDLATERRKAAASEAAFRDDTDGAPPSLLVNPGRVRTLLESSGTKKGPVLYWMSRDQRMRDNWALLYAVEKVWFF